MAQRERLTVAEVAREVARPQVDAAGHRTVLPDETMYQAVCKQVATDMVAGFFDDHGGIILATSSTPLKPLLGADFRNALAPYPGGAADPDFLLAHVAAGEASETSWDPGACITREGWAAWLRKRQYAWPAACGAEPVSAPQPKDAPKTSSKNKGGAPRKFDKEAFMTQAARLLAQPDGSRPKNRHQLTAAMAEWCLETWGRNRSRLPSADI
jgi:hypothetical protein